MLHLLFFLRHIKLINDAPRLAESPNRLILQLVEPETLRPSNLQPACRRGPLFRGGDGKDDDGKAVAVLLRAECLAVLSVDNAYEIRDDSKDLGMS